MRKRAKPESFIQKPLYPGGHKALNEFIRSNLKYPEEALKNKIEGSVKIAFDVDVFGDVHNTMVKVSVGHGCDEEAKRLVSLLKYEKKKYRGMHVVFHNSILIHFHLPGKVVKPRELLQPAVNIVYHYKESKN